jgi:hypothetical protein
MFPQGHEADHSLSSSAEVMNGGAISPLPICSHVLIFNKLIKPRENFTFYW